MIIYTHMTLQDGTQEICCKQSLCIRAFYTTDTSLVRKEDIILVQQNISRHVMRQLITKVHRSKNIRIKDCAVLNGVSSSMVRLLSLKIYRENSGSRYKCQSTREFKRNSSISVENHQPTALLDQSTRMMNTTGKRLSWDQKTHHIPVVFSF